MANQLVEFQRRAVVSEPGPLIGVLLQAIAPPICAIPGGIANAIIVIQGATGEIDDMRATDIATAGTILGALTSVIAGSRAGTGTTANAVMTVMCALAAPRVIMCPANMIGVIIIAIGAPEAISARGLTAHIGADDTALMIVMHAAIRDALAGKHVPMIAKIQRPKPGKLKPRKSPLQTLRRHRRPNVRLGKTWLQKSTRKAPAIRRRAPTAKNLTD